MMKFLTSQDPAKNLNKIREQLTPSEDNILTLLLEELSHRTKKHGGTTIPHKELALRAGVTPRTVTRAIKEFKLLGLITTQRRWDNSNVTKLTSFWRLPSIQKELSLSYRKYPLFLVTYAALSIGLLLSGNGFRENMSDLVFSLKTVIRNGINLKDPEMKEKISKILSIRDALLKRGETETIDPYKLMAFSNACLDDCIAKMKHATPRKPYSFFLQMALDYCKWNSEKPDWSTVDTLREQKLREFETVPTAPKGFEGHGRPAALNKQVWEKSSPVSESSEQLSKDKESPKREQATISYKERVRLNAKQEKEAAEARKTPRLSFEEELEGYEKQIEQLRAKGYAGSFQLAYAIRCRDVFIRDNQPSSPSHPVLI